MLRALENRAMNYSKIGRSAWRQFFDSVTKTVAGRWVELEIVGPKIGDQEVVTKLGLLGLSYDPTADALYLSMETGAESRINHVVQSPRDIYVDIGDGGLCGLILEDRHGQKEFVRLLEPLLLPPSSAALT